MVGTPETNRINGKKGGRPPGALTKMSKAKALELAKAGETPLDVMIDNMNFWRRRAAELTKVVEQRLQELNSLSVEDESQKIRLINAMKEFNQVAKSMIAARHESQTCAVDAAPYVHPKFTSITVKQQIQNVKIQMALAVAVSDVVQDDRSAAPDRIANGRAA